MATLEAAFLVPLILIVVCCLLIYTLQLFASASEKLNALYVESQTEIRQPAAVIRNTDLLYSFFQEEKP